MESLIRVKQLPVIEEQLRALKEAVDQRVSQAASLVCTEETVQAVKSTRSELNKEFRALEEQRKAVKKAVLGPYEQFEAIYKECVSDSFKWADSVLKKKVDETELEIKRRCEDGLREYFAERCEARHINFLRFEQAGIVVDMASAKAKTPKKLREQLEQFVSRVELDADMIGTMDDADEIMVEYKRTLDATGAIATVRERHRRMEEERVAQAAREKSRAMEAAAVAKVDAAAPSIFLDPPEEVVETEKEYVCVFKVRATMVKLRALKNYMNQEGIRYE